MDANLKLLSDGTSLWGYAVAVLSPLVVLGLRRLSAQRRIPKVIWPLITPAVGLLIGLALNAAAKAGLSAEEMAKAGALAVFVREVINQALKQFQPAEEPDSADKPKSDPPT